MIHIRVGATGPSDIAAILDFWAIHAENNSRPLDSSDALIGLVERDPDALILAIENGEASAQSSLAGMAGGLASIVLQFGRTKEGKGLENFSSIKPSRGLRVLVGHELTP